MRQFSAVVCAAFAVVSGVLVAHAQGPAASSAGRGRGETYRDACINHEPGPDIAIPAEHDHLVTPRYDDERPIFIGHYWLPPQRPAPLTPTVACLDYSVAGGGPLVAYRWDGERYLRPDKFVFDPTRLRERLEVEVPAAAA